MQNLNVSASEPATPGVFATVLFICQNKVVSRLATSHFLVYASLGFQLGVLHPCQICVRVLLRIHF